MRHYQRKTNRQPVTPEMLTQTKERVRCGESIRSIARSFQINESSLRKRLKKGFGVTSLGRFKATFSPEREADLFVLPFLRKDLLESDNSSNSRSVILDTEVKEEPDTKNDVTSLHEELIIKTEDLLEDVNETNTTATFSDNLSGESENVRQRLRIHLSARPWLENEETEDITKKKEKIKLCVLCMDDILKPHMSYSIADDWDVIFSVTGVNILQYPVLTCCRACYETLSSIKMFIKKVCTTNTFLTDCLKYGNKSQLTSDAEISEHNGTLEAHEVHVGETSSDATKNKEVEDDVVHQKLIGDKSFVPNSNRIEKMRQQLSAKLNASANYQTEDDKAHSENISETVFTQDSSVSELEPTEFVECQDVKKIFDEENSVNITAPKIKKRCIKVCSKRKPYIRKAPRKPVGNSNANSEILCRICGKMFARQHYHNHRQNHAAKVMCKVCNKEMCRSSLYEHMEKHGNREKHVCFVCGKSYLNSYQLQRHEVTHGEKQHRCNICQALFHHTKHLRRHMRTHSGEKPFACAYCDRKFSILWNKQQHERLHTNEKPYKCPVCQAAFRHNVVLKQHVSTAHSANEIRSCQINTAQSLESAANAGKSNETCNNNSSVNDSRNIDNLNDDFDKNLLM